MGEDPTMLRPDVAAADAGRASAPSVASASPASERASIAVAQVLPATSSTDVRHMVNRRESAPLAARPALSGALLTDVRNLIEQQIVAYPAPALGVAVVVGFVLGKVV